MTAQELNEWRNELFPQTEIALVELRNHFQWCANNLLAAQEDWKNGQISHDDFRAAEIAFDKAVTKLDNVVNLAKEL